MTFPTEQRVFRSSTTETCYVGSLMGYMIFVPCALPIPVGGLSWKQLETVFFSLFLLPSFLLYF